MNLGEVKALISLLDDEDTFVTSSVENKILSYGKEIIPYLEDAWGESFPGGNSGGDAYLQQRIENLIHKLQFEDVRKELSDWAEAEIELDPLKNPLNYYSLLNATLLVAKYQYPDLDETKLKEQLNLIKKDVWLELNDELTALEKVKILNHIFFDVYEFKGNTTNFHAPQNSYINNVLESKKGNPLLLSIIYSVIAQQLKIPIYGVNLPEHFVLAYMADPEMVINPRAVMTLYEDENQKKILFYINPFSKGAVFSRKEIDVFLKQLRLDPNVLFYEPSSNLLIIQRMIRNLINAYDKLGHVDKVEELKLLLNEVTKS